jgi:hypothetical protein
VSLTQHVAAVCSFFFSVQRCHYREVEEELSAAFICRIHNALRSPARCSVLFVLVLMFMLFLHEHSITIDTQVHLDLSFALMMGYIGL